MKYFILIIIILLTGCKDEEFQILDKDVRLNHIIHAKVAMVYSTTLLNINMQGLASYQNHETTVNDLEISFTSKMLTKAVFEDGKGVGSVVRNEPLNLECVQSHEILAGVKTRFIKTKDMEAYKKAIKDLVFMMSQDVNDFEGDTEEAKKRNKSLKTKALGDKIQSYEAKFFVFEIDGICADQPFYTKLKLAIPNEYIGALRDGNYIDVDNFYYGLQIFEMVNRYTDINGEGKQLVASINTMAEKGITDTPSRASIMEYELDQLPKKDYEKEYRERKNPALQDNSFTPHPSRSRYIEGAHQNLIEGGHGNGATHGRGND